MNTLHQALTEYLKLRRAFGYKLDRLETRLRRFLSFLDGKGTSRITTAMAVRGHPKTRHPGSPQNPPL